MTALETKALSMMVVDGFTWIGDSGLGSDKVAAQAALDSLVKQRLAIYDTRECEYYASQEGYAAYRASK